jgi:FkbM family methyltransferase
MNSKILEVCKNGTCFKVNSVGFVNYFWEKQFSGWENPTFAIFDRFLNARSIYLDVGAWIGPTVLYGAQIAGHVYAIEPDPTAYQELTSNLRLNPSIMKKVTCINCALASSPGTKRLYVRVFSGDSSSSLVPTLSNKNFTKVRGITVGELNNSNKITFIKMDIEAGEYSLIPAIQKYLSSIRPTLYLSLHPLFLKDEITLKMANKINKDSYAESHILNLTNKLLDSLSFYKYIYDSKGNIVDRDSILKERSYSAFVFTDEYW